MGSMTLAQYGQIDILVNNAGVAIALHEISPDTWDQIMATNLRGSFSMARPCPHTRQTIRTHH
jgi:3-oxoacyl-[acyl-carrier protein] reductase